MPTTIIDIGTNSIKFYAYQKNKAGQLELKNKIQEETGMGDNLDKNKIILPKKVEIVVSKIKKYTDKLSPETQILVLATEALRKAENTEQVVEEIETKTRVKKVNIISQKQEAEVYWEALIGDFDWDGYIAAIDIGGGSVQFMYGKKHNLIKSYLLRTGGLVLFNQFVKNNPPKQSEIKAYEDVIKKEIEQIKVKLPANTPFIHGSGAVLDFYREAKIPISKFKYSKKHSLQVDLETTKRFYDEVKELSLKKREKYFPSKPWWTAGMPIGLANVLLITKKVGLKYELPSNSNLIEGVVSLLEKGDESNLSL